MRRYLLVLLLAIIPVILQAQDYIYTDQYGTFDDGSGPEPYQDNTDLTYLIQPEGAATVNLTFTYFQTEGLYDHVYVYDGVDASAPLIGDFDGLSDEPFTISSTGNSVFIRFVSDESVTYDGWTIEYSGVISPQVYSQTYTSPSGSFDDGSGSKTYPNYFDGTYVIKPTGASKVKLSFPFFETESFCDLVYVYDGENANAPLIGTYDNSNLPPSEIISTGGSLCIRFVTDINVDYQGWTAQYSSVISTPPPGKTYTINLPVTTNYIHVISPQVEMQNVPDNTQARDSKNVDENVQYFDGLGRPLQTVTVAASAAGNDIIQPFVYDQYGREVDKYLPYTRASNNGALVSTTSLISEQQSFYNNIFSGEGAYAKSHIVYEPSPLNRVLEMAAPGADWQSTDETGSSSGHTVKTEYGVNTSQDVLLLSVDDSGNLINTGGEVYSGKSYYKANELYKTIVKDENWTSGTDHTTEEYKDKQGQVVLKRTFKDIYTPLETYYVYDDFGLLRYVLSPKASVQLTGVTFPLTRTDDLIKDLCYYYSYDNRHRMVEKQLPGADAVYMVYDSRDRLVLTQDGERRKEGNWLFTKYDALNRPVLTGIYYMGSTFTREYMQNDVDQFYSDAGIKMYEERTNETDNILGYTNSSYPDTPNEDPFLTATYYDTYESWMLPFDNTNNISGYSDSEGKDSRYFEAIKGQITCNRDILVGLTTTLYYDDHYRVIQSRRDLYGNSGKETVSNLYDFVGKVIQTKQSQIFGSTATTIEKNFVYDHADRLIKVTHQIIGIDAQPVTISEMTYNELGQLQAKKLAGGIQDVDYKYNIRGWLTSINNPDNLANDGTGDANADLFGMRLNYNLTENLAQDYFPQYNGNISQTIWKTQSGNKQGYSFDYYANNTLYSGWYSTNANGTWSDSWLGFEGRIDGYDENGNPYDLRRGISSGNYKEYYFDYQGGNQLKVLTDNNSNTYTYTYDKNGNMKHDGLRNFNFTYNILNLPQTISKGTDNLSYIYSATGEKLAKLKNGVFVQYYCGNMVYNSAKNLDYILFEEGIIKKVSSFTYEYYLKDHLGNTRVVFNSSGAVEQSNDYYPFGLSFPGTAQGITKYLYNGKELQDESLGETAFGMYDYGARFYDPEIGRFTTKDPLMEWHFNITPYHYCFNNPLSFIDPLGLDTIWYVDNKTPKPGDVIQNGDDTFSTVKGTVLQEVNVQGSNGNSSNNSSNNSSRNSSSNNSKSGFALYSQDGSNGDDPDAKVWAWLDYDFMSLLMDKLKIERKFSKPDPKKEMTNDKADKSVSEALTKDPKINKENNTNANGTVVDEKGQPVNKVYHIEKKINEYGNQETYIYRDDSVIYKVVIPGRKDTSIFKWKNESQLFRNE